MPGEQLDNVETLNTTKATRTAGMITIGYIQSPLYMQFENRRIVAELFIFESWLYSRQNVLIFFFFPSKCFIHCFYVTAAVAAALVQQVKLRTLFEMEVKRSSYYTYCMCICLV